MSIWAQWWKIMCGKSIASSFVQDFPLMIARHNTQNDIRKRLLKPERCYTDKNSAIVAIVLVNKPGSAQVGAQVSKNQVF